MTLRRFGSPIVAAPVALLLTFLINAATHADDSDADAPDKVAAESRMIKETWLRERSGQLEMQIQGRISSPTDAPLDKPIVTVVLVTRFANQSLPVSLVGNRYSVWVPMGQPNWYAIRLNVSSADDRMRVTKQIARIDARQAAAEGLDLPLQLSTRTITVNVLHQSRPVGDAQVKLELTNSSLLTGKTNASGQVQFELLPADSLRSFTAWTDDHRFGGFQFSRGPVRDPNLDEHSIELASCRKQVLRIVDGEGHPQSGLGLHLQVATPPPNYNYLGQIKASHMVTNELGEAYFEWFPDWKEVHCYVDLESDQWVMDGDHQWIDGDFVVQVKPKKTRQLASGALKRKNGSVAGFTVQWRSFQGEQERRSDHLFSTTDQEGRFSAMVLPGATYCVFVNDKHYISDMVDLIPCPTDQDKRPADLKLSLSEGTPVNIRLTTGDAQRPIENQILNVRQEHHFQWIENDKTRHGSSARDSWAITDHTGSATVHVIPNKKLEVSVYTPDWRKSETIDVTEGGPNLVQLHREFDQPRAVSGIVLQDKTSPVDLSKVRVVVGSIDGKTQQEEALTPRDNGVFSFESKATAIGILATSDDQNLAGVVTVDSPSRLLRVQLRPTVTVRGQLIDPQGKPIKGRIVRGTARLNHPMNDGDLNRLAMYMSAKKFETTTDENGKYAFEYIPQNIEFAMSTPSLTENRSHWLGWIDVQDQDVRQKPKTIED